MEEMVNRRECAAAHKGVDYRLDRTEARQDAHGLALDELTAAAAKQVEINRQMDALLSNLEERVRAVEGKSSRRAETVVTACLSALAGSGATYLVARMLK